MEKKVSDQKGRLLLQVQQGLHSLFHWSLLIETVDIKDVDVVHTELLEGLPADLVTVLGAAVYREHDLSIDNRPRNTELGGQEDVLATLGMLCQPLADEDLAVPVFLGGIPEGCAQLPCPVQYPEAFFIRPVIIVSDH